MCKQRSVVQKIIEHNEVNGFGVELAKAQMEDYITLNKKVSRIEKSTISIKKEQIKQGEMLAKQSGQIEVILNYITSPAEEERKNGIIWSEIKNIMKTKMGKVIIILALGCIALSGQRILELLHLI